MKAKASARSIVGFDIGSIIIAATQNKILLKGGGHKMAGGFTIHKSKIQEFKDFVISKFKKKSSELTKKKTLNVDSIIAPSAVKLRIF